jgi:hypothetical protein
MKALLFISAILIGSVAHAEKAETINTDARVVQLPGCTGFIVNGNYLFSAKHCLGNLGKKLLLKSKNYGNVECDLVYTSPTKDGPIVYKMAPNSKYKAYPSFKVSKNRPKIGELVHTVGFPGGNYAVTYGKVISGDGKGEVNIVSMRVSPGNSGGPLLNEDDEVVGITEAVDVPLTSNKSYFSSWGSTSKAIAAVTSGGGVVPVPKRGKTADVVIFTADWCSACKVLDRDITEEDYRSRGLNRIRVKNENGRWSNEALVREFKAKTGKDIPGLPTIWVRGSSEYKTGYSASISAKLSVLGWIVKGVKSLGILLFGNGRDGEILEPDTPDYNPVPDAGSVPPILDAPVSPIEGGIGQQGPIEQGVDWENISIIIAAKKQDLGYTRGEAVKILLKSIKGPIARANAEYFDGKANIDFVDERTQPIRYNSFVTAAGIDPGAFYIMVLVKKQSLGLKSLIAGRVEKSIMAKIPPETPIEIVFERIHGSQYVAITKSLEVFDAPPVEPSEADSMKEAIIASLKDSLRDELSGVKGQLTGIVVPSKEELTSSVVSNLGPAIEEIQKTQDENGRELSLTTRIIAGLLALFGLGKATGGLRGALKTRIASVLPWGKKEEEDAEDVSEAPVVPADKVANEQPALPGMDEVAG